MLKRLAKRILRDDFLWLEKQITDMDKAFQDHHIYAKELAARLKAVRADFDVVYTELDNQRTKYTDRERDVLQMMSTIAWANGGHFTIRQVDMIRRPAAGVLHSWVGDNGDLHFEVRHA